MWGACTGNEGHNSGDPKRHDRNLALHTGTNQAVRVRVLAQAVG
jgi:hypothetical protein